MPKSLMPVFVFAKIAVKRSFRDKTAIFFIILFPLIFLFIFGGIFSKDNSVSFRVALINQSDSKFAKQFAEEANNESVLKVDKQADTLEKAKEKMRRSQLDAAIILPADFGTVKNGKYPTGEAKIIYTQNSEQAGQTLSSVLQEQFSGINARLVKNKTPFSVKSEQSNEQSLKRFDYTFAGLIGFSIIGLGIFGPVNVFPELKKQGILRRLKTTPLKVWQYFIANVLSQTAVGLLSITIMFLVAMTIFDLNLVGNILELGIFIVLSIIMIF
ncbi:MAG TPA: ABC transporter permease, partial [Candidatus Saccharimonadales bacterium]|nr:ABC transporter permease [Candidatus Saccharimonadales bacterium]